MSRSARCKAKKHSGANSFQRHIGHSSGGEAGLYRMLVSGGVKSDGMHWGWDSGCGFCAWAWGSRG